MRKESFVLDYGKRILKTDSAEVDFEPLPSECVAILRFVTELPVGTPVRVQAELLGNHCGMYGDCQLVKTDEQVLAAPVVTKADDSNSVWLELVNTTRSNVSLQPGTKVIYLQPFNDLVDDSVHTIVEDEQKQTNVPMEDFSLSHLSEKEKTMLSDVLSRHHVWPNQIS